MSTRPLILAVAASVVLSSAVHAGGNKKISRKPVADQVELFAALESNQVDVKLIPKNAEQATVIIKNKTDKPLSIRMPEAFAGVPVLAQGGNNNRGGNRGGGGNNFGGGGGGGNQGFGGGFGGGGLGGGLGGGGFGGGFFNVGPDRVGKLKVVTVCLEHGKEDPNPRVPYEMKPIENFTKKAELIEVCKMLARGDLDQPSAQAAAWHLSDGLSWQELANKVKVRHLNGSTRMYFNARNLRIAMQAVHVAIQKTRANESDDAVTSPGEALSQK